jgi:predicted transcriptional regulator
VILMARCNFLYLALSAREIEARRTGIYRMSDDERAAVNQGVAEADQGKFVSDDLVAKVEAAFP